MTLYLNETYEKMILDAVLKTLNMSRSEDFKNQSLFKMPFIEYFFEIETNQRIYFAKQISNLHKNNQALTGKI